MGIQSGAFMSNSLNLHRANHTNHARDALIPQRGREEKRMSDDIALCGDETCEGPGCRQSALDAYYEWQEAEARAIVRSLLGLPE